MNFCSKFFLLIDSITIALYIFGIFLIIVCDESMISNYITVFFQKNGFWTARSIYFDVFESVSVDWPKISRISKYQKVLYIEPEINFYAILKR